MQTLKVYDFMQKLTNGNEGVQGQSVKKEAILENFPGLNESTLSAYIDQLVDVSWTHSTHILSCKDTLLDLAIILRCLVLAAR